jgi:hypothetical protein
MSLEVEGRDRSERAFRSREVEVTFSEAARYMRWSLPSLRTFVDKRPDRRVTLQSLVNRDLAGKVEKLVS